MSFATQVRQVMRRDAREARWFLVALGALLVVATLQGLAPDSRWSTAEGPLGTGWLVLRAAVMLAAATITLTFLPNDGPRAAWRALPITPTAVWVARLAWGALLVGVVGAVCLLALATVPLDASLRTEAVLQTVFGLGKHAIVGTLAALVAGSRTRVLLLLPVVVVAALVAFAFFAVTGTPEPIRQAILWCITPSGSLLLLAVGALLATWPFLSRQRGTAARWVGFAAAVLLLALGQWNAAHADAGSGIAREDAPGVTSAALLAGLDTTRISFQLSSGTDASDMAPPAGMAPVVVGAPWARLQLVPTIETTPSDDRIVWRPRHVWLGDAPADSLRLMSTADVIAVPGTLALPGVRRWLNAPPTLPLPVTAAVPQERLPDVRRENQTASVTLEVERQRATILAQLPLGEAGAATGPWQRLTTAQLVARSDGPAVRVKTVLLRGPRTDGRTTPEFGFDLSFALLNPSTGEAVHLVAHSRNGGDSGWMLDPTLFRAHTLELQIFGSGLPVTPDSLGQPHYAYPDDAWLRASSLVMIGWEVVERGPLTLSAPLTARVTTTVKAVQPVPND